MPESKCETSAREQGLLSISDDRNCADSQPATCDTPVREQSYPVSGEEVNLCGGIDCPCGNESFKDRISQLNLNLHTVSNVDDKVFLRGLPEILHGHPHVFAYIKSVEISDVPDDYCLSEDYQLQRRVLEGLITHAKQASLEVLKLEDLAWPCLTPDMRDLVFRLINSCPRLRTLSLHVCIDLFPYTLDFLDSLQGLEDLTFVDLECASQSYYNYRSPIQVIRCTERLLSPRASSSRTFASDSDIFLQRLHVGGQAAEILADYLGCPGCPFKLTRLIKLQIESEGEHVGNGVTKILNMGASEPICSLAWCPTRILLGPLPGDFGAFGNKESDAMKEMNIHSLVLSTPECGGERFGMHLAFSSLSSKFKVKADCIEELILSYDGYEIPDPSETNWLQSGPEKIMYGLSLALEQANEDFNAMCSEGDFSNLQKIKLWLPFVYIPKSWEELTELGKINPTFWTPSMGGDWVSSDDWPLAKKCAPEMHKSKTFLLRIVPSQEDTKIFRQMNLDSS